MEMSLLHLAAVNCCTSLRLKRSGNANQGESELDLRGSDIDISIYLESYRYISEDGWIHGVKVVNEYIGLPNGGVTVSVGGS